MNGSALQPAKFCHLVTDLPLLESRFVVHQDVYAKLYCTVGSVRDGPMTCLLDRSAERIEALGVRAAFEVENLSKNYSFPEPCSCCTGTKRRRCLSYATLGDIVVDFERCAVGSSYASQSDSSMALGFEEEAHRMMVLIDDWMEWLSTKHHQYF